MHFCAWHSFYILPWVIEVEFLDFEKRTSVDNSTEVVRPCCGVRFATEVFQFHQTVKAKFHYAILVADSQNSC